jgi:hypothetical protein
MHTVTYCSRRIEVWRWYWRAWARPAGLWRFHVLFGLTVALISTETRRRGTFDWTYFCVAAVFGFLCALVLLPLWPQMRFKSAVRSLTINAEGLTTSIGKISASRQWKDVRSIDLEDGAVIITGNSKNAFIIPSRAFADDRERVEFYKSAQRWHADATV